MINMRGKKWIIVPLAFLCFALVLYWNHVNDRDRGAAEDEITLQITLDTKEDFGLLIIDYRDASGSGGQGGISNADKSLLKHTEQLFFTLPKHAFDEPDNIEDLSIQFSIITEYVDPNFENIYPAEITIPLEAISLKASFGRTYSIVIYGDTANGYRAVLEKPQ